ncbi:MAG: flavoprotein [Candidatus Sigynarchaeota archaeon]
MSAGARRKILWCITSSGDKLRETIDLMIEVQSWHAWDIEVALSREAPFVLKYYDCWKVLKDHFSKVMEEKGPNTPFLGGQIQRKRYAFILVAPVTANTMAKIACGIADSLVSNCVSLGLKARVPVYLYPTDQGTEVETVLRDGSTLKLYPRKVDLDNLEKVRAMDDVTVFKNIEEMAATLEKLRGS